MFTVALQAIPTISGGTMWTLGGINYNLHSCLLKSSLVHLGILRTD